MKFTLQNFDQHVSATILQRGLQYFNNGAITNIENTDNECTAEVQGTEIYTVNIILTTDEEIVDHFCDCPYDGNICKHVIAVLFALREEEKQIKITPKKPGKKDEFESLLNKISTEDYKDFIKYYTSKHKDFKLKFEMFFADRYQDADNSPKYAELIKKLIGKFANKGFIDYRASITLSKEISGLINKAHNLIVKKNYKDAFSISQALLVETIEVITYCDDSSGAIGGTICDIIELIDLIITSDDTAIALKEFIFVFLLTELNKPVYWDYGDFGYDIFELVETLALYLNAEDDFLKFINVRLPQLTGQYDNYEKDFFIIKRINFLINIGRQEEADVLTQQNIHVKNIRQGEVDKAIEAKNYTLAKALINAGIKIAKDEPGTIFEWEKELLRIAVLQNDLITTRSYCKKLAFDHQFDKQYYNQWKQTYNTDEWRNVIENFIGDTIQNIIQKHNSRREALNSQLLDTVGPIYIQENYIDRILILLENETDLAKIGQYHYHLLPKYSDELLNLYLPALEHQGNNANDRRQYSDLVHVMKIIIKDIPIGKSTIIAIAQNLKNKYPRRPAMIDELNKILL